MKKLVSIASALFLLTASNIHSMEYAETERKASTELLNPLCIFITDLNDFIEAVQSTNILNLILLITDLKKLRADYNYLKSPACFGPYPCLLEGRGSAGIDRIINQKLNIDNMGALLNENIYTIKHKLSEDSLYSSVNDWESIFIGGIENIGKECFFGAIIGTGYAISGILAYKYRVSTAPKLTLLGACGALALGSLKSGLELFVHSLSTANYTIKNALSASARIGILYGASKLFWQYTILSSAQVL